MNYQKIAEGLSKALLELNDIVAQVSKETLIYPTTAMQQAIANLYAHIFLFLKEVIDWYTKKSRSRLLASFREDFYEHFEDHLRAIREISWSVNREAQASHFAEGRYTRLMVEDLAQKLSAIIGSDGRRREEAVARFEQRRRRQLLLREGENISFLDQDRQYILQQFRELLFEEQLGVAASGMLCTQAQSFIANKGSSNLESQQGQRKSANSPSTGSSEVHSDQSHATTQTREQIELYSKHLEDYFNRNDTRPSAEMQTVFFANSEVVLALQEWTSDMKGPIFCVSGPAEAARPSSTSVLAAQYVSRAARTKIPFIVHFCSLLREPIKSTMTLEACALISLTYSLIRQLVELVPLELPLEAPSLTSERFSSLDGSLGSWSEAMRTLEDLLSLAPPLFFILIDGIQWLDDKSTDKHLQEFFALLRRVSETTSTSSKDTVQRQRTIKILFTTTGASRALTPNLSRRELLMADCVANARTPGRSSPGRIPLSPLTPPGSSGRRKVSPSPLAGKKKSGKRDDEQLFELVCRAGKASL